MIFERPHLILLAIFALLGEGCFLDSKGLAVVNDGNHETDGDADVDADTESTPICGDDVCNSGESATTCPNDCLAQCGDEACTHDETGESCPEDCVASCGNGVCDPEEYPSSCAVDCGAVCEDGMCTHDENAETCPEDCDAICGDEACTHDENAETCSEDCNAICGDEACTHDETASTCDSDCPPICGDDACTHDETYNSCPDDCPANCGDDECLGETAETCPDDCPESCGDDLCTHTETAETCPDDCPESCGDDLCTHTEDACTCTEDCGDTTCGDDLCCGDETTCSCELDCGTDCGDGCCNGTETGESCADDCLTVNHRLVTIDPSNVGLSCSSDLRDFPLLLVIENDENLRASEYGGHVASALGYDISFTDSDRPEAFETLDHEIETYDPQLGSLVAWIRIPMLFYDQDTSLIMSYGDTRITTATENPADVWNDDFLMVHHLADEPGSVISDSTQYGNSSDVPQGMTYGEEGQIGSSLLFDEVDDYYAVDDFSYGNTFTISMWVRVSDNSGDEYQYFFSHRNYNDNPSINFMFQENWGDNHDDLSVAIYDDYDAESLRSDVSERDIAAADGQWHHLSVSRVRNGTNRLYVDGEQQDSVDTSNTSFDPSGSINIGRRVNGDPDRYYGGWLDEIRVSNTERDACWVETEYANQLAPEDFLIIGSEE